MPPVLLLSDPHENHAGRHVQTPDGTGDAHVHISSVLPRAGQLWLVHSALGLRGGRPSPHHFTFTLI